MSIAFSRTMRTLEAERPHRSLLGVALLVLLGMAWLAWLFLARVPVYALASSAIVEEGAQGVPTVRLQVPAALALGRIRPAQPARFSPEGFPASQRGSLPATVARVGEQVEDGEVSVELTLLPAPDSLPLRPGMGGAAQIEVARLSPATLLLRAIGYQRE